jgi:hypothetical protein
MYHSAFIGCTCPARQAPFLLAMHPFLCGFTPVKLHFFRGIPPLYETKLRKKGQKSLRRPSVAVRQATRSTPPAMAEQQHAPLITPSWHSY